MALLGTAIIRTSFGSVVVADNDAGALKISVYDVAAQTVLVAAYTLVGSGVVGNPALTLYGNGSILMLYLTGTNTRHWRMSLTHSPASSSDWVTP